MLPIFAVEDVLVIMSQALVCCCLLFIMTSSFYNLFNVYDYMTGASWDLFYDSQLVIQEL